MRRTIYPEIKSFLSVALIILIAAMPAWADSRSLHWSELRAFVANRSVAVTLPDTTRIEGDAVLVDTQRIVIDVRKTDDPRNHPAGHQSIPRAQATILTVSRPTVRWRVIGTTAGGVIGIPVGGIAVLEKDGVLGGKNSGWGLVIGAIGGLAAIGFAIGWAADHRKTIVTIIPDGPLQ